MSSAAAPATPVNGRGQSEGGQAETARAVFSGVFELLAFAARRAGLALVWMVVWGLVAAICVIGAWMEGALAMWAVSLGLSPPAAVGAMAAINLGAAGALFYVCVWMSRALLFSATRRQPAGEKCPVKPASP